MSKETLHMKVGPLLGEHLLEIAQSNIMKGNIEKGLNTYIHNFLKFPKEKPISTITKINCIFIINITNNFPRTHII